MAVGDRVEVVFIPAAEQKQLTGEYSLLLAPGKIPVNHNIVSLLRSG